VEGDVLVSTVRKQVRKAVADLPAPHREAIFLAYYQGLTYREVATALSIPEGTAKWRLRNALHRIGEQLTAEGFQDTASLG
jgi:RNA polymerase sigma-70 factor (ECF subfamily)